MDGYDYEESDDSDEYIEYDESKIPEVKLFHKFCQPLNENPLPAGKHFESAAGSKSMPNIFTPNFYSMS